MTLFSKLSKYSTESEIRDLFGEVQSSFSEEQKKGVLASLMRVSDADHEFHFLEEELLRMIAWMLDYELKESRRELKNALFEIDADEVLVALGSLDEGQKDWYIFIMAALVESDMKILKVEILYAKIFLEHMQISNERFEKVVSQSRNLTVHFA